MKANDIKAAILDCLADQLEVYTMEGGNRISLPNGDDAWATNICVSDGEVLACLVSRDYDVCFRVQVTLI